MESRASGGHPLFIFRHGLVLALTLAWWTVALSAAAAAQAPRIARHRPAPPSTSTMPPLRSAEIDNSLAIGGDEIDARKVETRLTVPVKVNGRGPYQFIVDSGADTSVVGLRIARDLQLPLGRPVVLNNMTDRNIVDRVKVDELSLGPSTIRDLELPALREQDVGGAGMIGIDALVRQRVMMDFEKRTIKIEDATKRAKRYPGEIVVVARLRRGQLILTQVKAAGLLLDAVIDTGSQVTIGNLALRDQLVRRRRDKLTTISATGVTGKTINLELATIPELRLGPVTLRNVPMAFADVPPFKVFGLSDQPALLLGTDLLEAFRRVSLDFRARKVRFQLRRCRTETIAISTWGASSTRLSSTGAAEVCGR
ncbi:MAG TPA: retroviral-like aspartic protease family protein [Allosphingosinicella sp.]